MRETPRWSQMPETKGLRKFLIHWRDHYRDEVERVGREYLGEYELVKASDGGRAYGFSQALFWIDTLVERSKRKKKSRRPRHITTGRRAR